MQKKESPHLQIHFVRHGQTTDNSTGTIAGHQPGKLTQNGIDQAKQTGIFLKNQEFDFVYVSDLGRTKQTYENIASQTVQIKKLKPIYTPLIREKCGGVLEGKPLKSWKENADKQGKDIRVYRSLKGQSWEDVNARAHKFLFLLIKEHLPKYSEMQVLQKEMKDLSVNGTNGGSKPIKTNKIKILVVTHGGFIMQFHNVVNFITKKKPAVFENTAKNCSFHVFKVFCDLKQGQKFNEESIKIECIKNNINSHLK